MRGYSCPFQARAKELLPQLPRIETIVYHQCVKEAKTTVALAKCAVRVFDARDNAQLKAEEEEAHGRKRRPVFSIIAHRRPHLPRGYGSKSLTKQLYEKSGQSKNYQRDTRRNPIRAQIRKRNFPSKTPLSSSRSGKLSASMDPLLRGAVDSKSQEIQSAVEQRMRKKRKVHSGSFFRLKALAQPLWARGPLRSSHLQLKCVGTR